MKHPLMSFAIGVAVCLSTAAPALSDPASSLAGEWVVDLSATPDQPYTQPMRLMLAPDGTVTGEFYNSAIEAGRWETARGRTCVSFRTSDGAGPYHTAACLVGNGVQGQTWAEHRDFLFNWNAARRTSADPNPQ
jgi:hypothetical protein